jgi:Dolichyl-phosphate-mannose-protein mannosyltransferase
MNKIFTMAAGVGVGAALVYLFTPTKKRPCGESAYKETADTTSDWECVKGASPVGNSLVRTRRAQPPDELDHLPSGFAPTTRVSETEEQLESRKSQGRAPNSQIALEPSVEPLGLSRTMPANTYRPVPGRYFRALGKVERGCGYTSKQSLTGRVLRRVLRGGRPVYRFICRVSFRACLCTAGLRILVRVFGNGKARGLARVTNKRLSKKEYAVVAGVTSLAFLTRLAVLPLRPILSPDGVYYATLGKFLAEGNLKAGLSAFWSPLYPFLVGLSSLVFRDVQTGGKFVSVSAGGLLVIPVYLLARALHGKDAAAVAAFLVAVNPTLIQYSTRLLTESTYTLLLAVVLFKGLTILTGGGAAAFFSTGAALGACYLIRPEAIGYTGLVLALALYKQLSVDSPPPSDMLRNVLGLVVGFSLLSFPYILFLSRATGRWTISEKLRAHIGSTESWERKWFGLAEDWPTTLADRLYAGSNQKGDVSGEREATPVEAQSLRRMISRSFEALRSEIQLVVYRGLPPHLMMLAGFGLFQTDWTKEVYLLLFLGSTLIGYALCANDISDRLLVPLLPLQLCWAAKGIEELERRLAGSLARVRFSKALPFINPPLLRPLALTALAFSLLPSLAYKVMTVPAHQQLGYRQAGAWVKEHSGTPALVMATDPFTAFYAGRRHLYLPAEEYATVIEHARRQKVAYLVIDEAVVSQGRWGENEYAGLQFLLDERGHHPELELVYKFDDLPGRKLLIFTLA